MKLVLIRIVPLLLAVAGGAAIALWLRADVPPPVKQRVSTLSLRPILGHEVKFPGQFAAGDGRPSDLPGGWPWFRGPNHSGISPETVPLARAWGPSGPKPLWTTTVGVGYAAPAIRNGRVYILDYDEVRQADTLRCLALADGREIWRRWYVIPIDSDHGVSRTVPAVTDRYVVTLGPKCHVMCVDAATGDFRWGLDLVKEYRTQWPKWYAGQCPLVDRDRAILAPAGAEWLMVAMDCATGQPVWKTPNPRGWKMTHSSITPVEFAGRRMYVYCASGGAVGVAAGDGPTWKAGDVLWEHDDWRVGFANVPSPVDLGNGRILLSGGYGAGSMMIQLKEDGGRLTTEKVWRLTKSSQFGAEQQTPIFYNGYIYGVLPKEAGSLGNRLVCLGTDGKQVWTSAGSDRFGLGPFIIADGLIFVMNDNGLLTVAEATPAGYKPLAKAKVLDGHETWAPLALAGGRLIVRDLTHMVCLDVSRDSNN